MTFDDSAIDWLANAWGARRVVADSPTGDRHSSATVWSTKTAVSTYTGAVLSW